MLHTCGLHGRSVDRDDGRLLVRRGVSAHVAPEARAHPVGKLETAQVEHREVHGTHAGGKLLISARRCNQCIARSARPTVSVDAAVDIAAVLAGSRLLTFTQHEPSNQQPRDCAQLPPVRAVAGSDVQVVVPPGTRDDRHAVCAHGPHAEPQRHGATEVARRLRHRRPAKPGGREIRRSHTARDGQHGVCDAPGRRAGVGARHLRAGDEADTVAQACRVHLLVVVDDDAARHEVHALLVDGAGVASLGRVAWGGGQRDGVALDGVDGQAATDGAPQARRDGAARDDDGVGLQLARVGQHGAHRARPAH
mmetsp:Transcript_2006/g.6443  ORF Transcript_2006/g.6443 Transcript_2006/m.6443 type:complete len:308 (+) Transcript_2006:1103-2026(+)